MFALAEEGLPIFFGDEGFRRKVGPLVRSVAERLIGGLAAGAKVIFFTCLEIDSDRLVVRNCWLVHGFIFLVGSFDLRGECQHGMAQLSDQGLVRDTCRRKIVAERRKAEAAFDVSTHTREGPQSGFEDDRAATSPGELAIRSIGLPDHTF